MKFKLTILLVCSSIFSFCQSWVEISQGLFFTDYIYFNNTHFAIKQTSSSGTGIYKYSNGNWNRVFFGTVTDYKIFKNKFIISGDFIDSFNLRFFEDDSFKPFFKTNHPIANFTVYGDSLLVEEYKSVIQNSSKNTFYWLFNNSKIDIPFSFSNSAYIPFSLSSTLIIKNILYAGGRFQSYCCIKGNDTMHIENTNDLYEINLITNSVSLKYKGVAGWGWNQYKIFSYRDSLNYIENSWVHRSGGLPGYDEYCSSSESNLPFSLCNAKSFATENDTLFYVEDGILKKSFNWQTSTINNDSIGVIVSLGKNRDGFFAVDKNGKMFHFNYSGMKLGMKSESNQTFQIYPNPAQTEIHILGNILIEEIKIYDSLGHLVNCSIQNNIDISNLVNGIYFISINGHKPMKFSKRSY